MEKQILTQNDNKLIAIENFVKRKMLHKLAFFFPLISLRKIKLILQQGQLNNTKKIFNKVKFFSQTKAKTRLISKKGFNKNLLKNLSFIKINTINKNVKKIILIKITPNNTRIIITDIKGNVLKNISSGQFGLKSSKKNYKVIYNLVLNELITFLKKNKNKKHILFRFCVPKIIRRKVLRRLKFYQKTSNIFEILRLMPFNGCRPPKMRRKKRKGLRIFKPSL